MSKTHIQKHFDNDTEFFEWYCGNLDEIREELNDENITCEEFKQMFHKSGEIYATLSSDMKKHSISYLKAASTFVFCCEPDEAKQIIDKLELAIEKHFKDSDNDELCEVYELYEKTLLKAIEIFSDKKCSENYIISKFEALINNYDEATMINLNYNYAQALNEMIYSLADMGEESAAGEYFILLNILADKTKEPEAIRLLKKFGFSG